MGSRVLLATALAVQCVCTVHSFTLTPQTRLPSTSREGSRSGGSKRRPRSRLHMFDPSHAVDSVSHLSEAFAATGFSLDFSALHDAHAHVETAQAAVATAAGGGVDEQQWLSSVLNGLADEAAAVPEEKKADWFASWTNFLVGNIKSLNNFYSSMGIANSFGLAIATFTFVVKIFLFPLNYLQIQSTEAVNVLKPVQEEIKEKFANNKLQQQDATARLYEATKVNPLAGCLPSLFQIPVFIGLYRALAQLAAEQAVDQPFLWIPNLEGPVFDKGRGIQWLTENWQNGAPSLGWHDTLLYALAPVLLVVTQTLSMRMTAPPVAADDEAAQRTSTVLKFLPLLIGWFSLNVPAALTVYWMVNNFGTTATTVGLKKYFQANPPKLDIPEDILEGRAEFDVQSLEDAIKEARRNAQPPRASRRMA